MLPLEVVFLMMVFLWGMAGLARGFSKEVGTTIAAVLAMTAVRVFGPLLVDTVNKTASKLSLSFRIPAALSVPAGVDAFCAAPTPEQFVFYSLTFGAIVFMGYQGQTLEIPVKIGHVTGGVAGFFVGLVNGYLIAGNLWFFLDKCARYNVPSLGITNVGVLSPTAQTIIKILPLNVLSEPIMLLGLLFLLLLFRIAK